MNTTKTADQSTARSRGEWLGMNWIRQEKRLAIYLRDGCACVWCGSSERLSLDHLKPHAKGGSNHEGNLVAACMLCNDRRGSKGQKAFALIVADGEDRAALLLNKVRTTSRRSLAPFLPVAKELVAKHGSAAKALLAA